MRKIIISLVSLSLLLICGCSSKIDSSKLDKCLYEINNTQGLTIDIDESTITNYGFSYVINNNLDKSASLTYDFDIDIYVDGIWYEYPINVTIIYSMLIIDPNCSYSINFDTRNNTQGNTTYFEKGLYRIHKTISFSETGKTYYFGSEFEIK